MRLKSCLVVLVACAAGCARQAPAPGGKGTIRYIDLANMDVKDVPMLLAQDDLRAQGYDVKVTYIVGSDVMLDAVARGDADLGMVNNQLAWAAAAKGAPVRTIAEFADSTNVLVTKAEMRSCKDLDGRPLGMPGPKSFTSLLTDLYLKKACPGTAPNMMLIREGAGRQAALMAGELDGMLSPLEAFLKLEEDAPGKFRVMMSFRKEFPDIRIQGIQARVEWLRQNPETAKDFLRALLRAQRKVMANPPMLFAESVKRLSISPAEAETVGKSHLASAVWDANGGLTEANIQKTLEFLQGVGAEPAGLKAGDVADLSYLNAVLDEMGRQ